MSTPPVYTPLKVDEYRVTEESEVERLTRERDEAIPMLLYCPACGVQHVDEPDNRTEQWNNPPHRSHLCHGCGHIWRPCDLATVGVVALFTKGKADSTPAFSRLTAAIADVARLREALRIQDPRNSTERYELIADAFWAQHYRMAPGQSRPQEMGSDPDPDETQRLWRKFCNEWHERFFDESLRAELAGGGKPAKDMDWHLEPEEMDP